MFDHLPQELLAEILSRLPVKSILICRCVSKTWYSLITDPSFIAHHLKKTAARNSGLLFFGYVTEELDFPFKPYARYLLYPDESFPANHVEELDCPLKGLKVLYKIVGSCNGVFCLSYGRYNRVVLWNPSVRKIVKIPWPNVTLNSHGLHKDSLGFGFDSSADDYKLVRIVYLPAPDKTGVWYAIVSFSLGEEVFGEMEVPDCLVEKYPIIDVAVSDGSLLLVVVTKLTEEGCFSVWMMKEYGVPGSWTKLFNISGLERIQRLVAFRQSGEVLLAAVGGDLVFYDPNTEEISATEISGCIDSFYLDTLVESLVLLDEPNEFAEEEPSEDDGSSGDSNEHSSSPDGVDMDLQKNSKGNKNANRPIILNEANEILEEVSSTSNSQIVIDEANEGRVHFYRMKEMMSWGA
ncbi:hypothetical protein GH714_001303 [Hevea brasiliensis]|uniref:F-box domain-containing protein n=1 Tax=Hevea brasiliensis TaxID=3981 RepID=A0A6A6KWK4_HEVBR|nr:hypothetical protein GH714_001303 [Hevea brasiliensis]